MPGLKTFFHEKKSQNEKTRMICLIKEQELANDTIFIREDLMNERIPSIWLEIKQEHKQNIIVCGFYREWSNDGLLSIEEQLVAINQLITLLCFLSFYAIRHKSSNL